MSRLAYLLFILTLIILPACNLAGSQAGVPETSNSASLSLAAQPTLPPVNYDHFEPVRALKQPKNMDCWATALTILYSWKNKDNTISIENVVKKYGDIYLVFFQTNAGITEKDEAELYKKARLSVIKGSNPTIATWYDLLIKQGPLSITVAIKASGNPPKRFIHALVVNGIKGDGTLNNTFIDYVDPADGKQHKLAFAEFIKLYEGASTWPLQIIYWP